MVCEYKIVRRVEFSDTDMAGIMHFANFFKFMEAAEHAFFRSLGFSVILPHSDPPLSLPRVHAECDYKYPLRFEDEVEVRLLVQKKKSRSLSYQFRFNLLNQSPLREAARGSMTVVCVARQVDGGMAAVPIPQYLAEQIVEAPASLLMN